MIYNETQTPNIFQFSSFYFSKLEFYLPIHLTIDFSYNLKTCPFLKKSLKKFLGIKNRILIKIKNFFFSYSTKYIYTTQYTYI